MHVPSHTRPRVQSVNEEGADQLQQLEGVMQENCQQLEEARGHREVKVGQVKELEKKGYKNIYL